MKRLLSVFVALVICAGAAQADHFGVYSDQAGSLCYFSSLIPPPGSNTAYVIHKFNAGSTASQFKVNDTSGLFATTQTFPAGYLTIGTWNTDLSIAYGGCVIGDHVVATLNFLWFGAPATCSQRLDIVSAPTTPIPGEIALVDCAQPSGNLESASGGTFFVPNITLMGCPDPCQGTPTEQSTWGAVKALYR